MTPLHDAKEVEFEYQPSSSGILFAGLFFGACSIIGVFAARSNQGFVINGLLRFSPQWAAIFWWILTAVSLAFVLAATFMTCHRVFRSQRIVLTPTAMIVPRSRWSREEITIPYGRITSIAERQVHKYKFLTILHSGGKIEINAMMLPEMAYETIRETLQEALDNPLIQRESRIWELTQANCPKCGVPFTRSAVETALSDAERAVSVTQSSVTQSLQDAELRTDTPVQVYPNYPIYCEHCRAQWWYGPARNIFKPRTESDVESG